MDENDRVFRISGIPAELPQAALGSVLDAVFAAESGSGIKTTVRSLGPHPQRGTHMVATVTFSSVPQKLSKGASWQLSETVEHNNQSIRLDLEIDVGFLGFTPTNTPIGDESDRIDCIAVSGLSSHPFGSWKKRGGRFMWLVDDDAAVPSNVRMLLYGYDTSLVASQSFQNVTDIGKSLAAAVQGIRPSAEGAFEPRPIVFIAHSLGGLVVKEAICHMVKTDPRVARCVYGLIFFGVPHNGLLVDPWLRIVENRPNEQLITALKPHSQYLQRLAQEFGQAFALGKSRVISIYETMTNLPKFNGKFDPDYLVLRPYLQKIWANAVADIQLRFETAPSQAEAETAEAFRGLVQLWPAEEAGRSSGELRTEFE
ncbi:hypothetical protein B0T14DRAFT_427376 [Immersiella caudata]|uniref:DUF676 domain-containing protein n=1 Tax=Immersiella caudata TaxID=314043 RepID=A0AA39WYT3_9PEZI|nr:hypothetical protein B0T14DRAFT_427376 [Immersiella caudata]